MNVNKKPEDLTLAKIRLRESIENGDLTLGQAVQNMRKITGMNQKDFARKIVGISPRVLVEIERDVANPTIGTLNKITRPFGYYVGFIHKND